MFGHFFRIYFQNFSKKFSYSSSQSLVLQKNNLKTCHHFQLSELFNAYFNIFCRTFVLKSFQNFIHTRFGITKGHHFCFWEKLAIDKFYFRLNGLRFWGAARDVAIGIYRVVCQFNRFRRGLGVSREIPRCVRADFGAVARTPRKRVSCAANRLSMGQNEISEGKLACYILISINSLVLESPTSGCSHLIKIDIFCV